MTHRAAEVAELIALIQKLCGVCLNESKLYLLETRLDEILARHGLASYQELARAAASPGALKLRQEIIEAITTRETLFFRDEAPFQALQHKVLPELIDLKEKTPFPRRIRIWSAACSTGQEPYSIAIVLRETIPNVDAWDVQILATDISQEAIDKASRGEYEPFEVQRGLPQRLLHKYFQQQGKVWRVRDSLRWMIKFERRNLLDPFTGLGPFDIVFCRNVLIYFDKPTRRDILLRLCRVMPEYGYLFVGSSEYLGEFGPQFRPQHHCRAVYYRPNLPAQQPQQSGNASNVHGAVVPRA